MTEVLLYGCPLICVSVQFIKEINYFYIFRVLFGEVREEGRIEREEKREKGRGRESRSQQPAQLRPRVWFTSAHRRGTGTAEAPPQTAGEKATEGEGQKVAAREREGKKVREEGEKKKIFTFTFYRIVVFLPFLLCFLILPRL